MNKFYQALTKYLPKRLIYWTLLRVGMDEMLARNDTEWHHLEVETMRYYDVVESWQLRVFGHGK